MIEWMNSVESSHYLAYMWAGILITATGLSILGLLITILMSIVNVIIAPFVFLAKVTEQLAQATIPTNNKIVRRSTEITGIENSPFSRF